MKELRHLEALHGLMDLARRDAEFLREALEGRVALEEAERDDEVERGESHGGLFDILKIRIHRLTTADRRGNAGGPPESADEPTLGVRHRIGRRQSTYSPVLNPLTEATRTRNRPFRAPGQPYPRALALRCPPSTTLAKSLTPFIHRFSASVIGQRQALRPSPGCNRNRRLRGDSALVGHPTKHHSP